MPSFIRVALCLVFLTAYSAVAAELRIGRAAVNITPPVGTPMGGDFTIHLSTGVHDELFCRALVIEVDREKAGIVSCDVESFHRPTVVAARRQIDRDGALTGERVMITATHSHSGPEMTPLVLEGAEGEAGRLAREYHAALPAKIAEAVRMAAGSTAPARAWAATALEDSISFNRRFLLKDGSVRMNPGQRNPTIVRAMGPIDPAVSVVYFDSPDDKPLATQVSFAMHSTAMGGREFSGDYPAALEKVLATVKGESMMTQFLQGCSGNVNQVDVRSTERQFGPQVVARLGTILGATVLKAYRRLEPVPPAALQVRSEIAALPVPAFSPEEIDKARQLVERSRRPGPGAPQFLELVHAFKVLNVMERHGGKPLQAEIQVITLGDKLAWVGLPGEVFVELGLALRLASPFPYTVISELANDMFDYFPDRKAFDEGGYEVVTARSTAGSGEVLIDTARRLLAEMHRAAYSNPNSGLRALR